MRVFTNIFRVLFACAFVLVKYANAQSGFLALKTPVSSVKGTEKGVISNVIGYDETGYYLLMNFKGDFHVQKTDASFNEIKHVSMSSMDLNGYKKHEFKMAYLVGNVLIALFANETDAVKQLIAVELNKTTLLPQKPPLKVMEVPLTGKNAVVDFKHTISPRNKNILLVSVESKGNDTIESYKFIMLDSNLISLWNRTMSGQDFVLKNFYADDDGRAFLLGLAIGEWCLKMISGQQSEPLAYMIKPNDKVGSIECIPDTLNNTFCIAGFYQNSKTLRGGEQGWYISGYFFRRLNSATLKEEIKTEGKVSDLIIKGLKNPVNEYYLSNMKIERIICNKDESCYLVTERYSVTSSYTQGNYFVSYNARNILAFRLNKSGVCEWVYNIAKDQTQHDVELSYIISYTVAATNDKLYIFFNDNKNNYKKEEVFLSEYAGFYNKDASITVCTLTSSGQLERKKMIECDKKCMVAIMPPGCRQLNDKRVFITMQGKDERSFGILNLE